MRIARWWFENRETGEITVAQFPNWPLFGVGLAWLIGRISADEARWHEIASVSATALWIYWGADEVMRGVNPWRRFLGAAVTLWQTSRLVW